MASCFQTSIVLFSSAPRSNHLCFVGQHRIAIQQPCLNEQSHTEFTHFHTTQVCADSRVGLPRPLLIHTSSGAQVTHKPE